MSECEKDRGRERKRVKVRLRVRVKEKERDNTKGKLSLLAGNYNTEYISIKCRKKKSTRQIRKKTGNNENMYIYRYIDK